eukprot:GHVS01032006.1.p1 GENE.GHVS01032006.1~~GHVS01032006.1.p1  ORF type:complete len:476 (-),score=37.55 GHVS01032006.1:269-1696(-)
MASPPSFHLPFRTIAKKHRKTLFHLLLAVGALYLLPLSWQSNLTKDETIGHFTWLYTGSEPQPEGSIRSMPPVAVKHRRGKGTELSAAAKRASSAGKTTYRAILPRPEHMLTEETPTAAAVQRRRAKRKKVSGAAKKASSPVETTVGLIEPPVFVWLHKSEHYSNAKSGRSSFYSDNKKVMLSGATEESKNTRKLLGIESLGTLLLNDPTIIWKQTKASSVAKGIWLNMEKHRKVRETATYVTVLILFQSTRTEYAAAEEIRFSRKPGDDAEMTVNGVLGGHIAFPPDIVWKTHFKPTASSPQTDMDWVEGADETLRIIYFAGFGGQPKTNFPSGPQMTQSFSICDRLDDMTSTYAVVLEINANQLKIELESNKMLLVNGRICLEHRTILLESDFNFDQLFRAQEVGTANSGGGSDNGVITIILRIPVLNFTENKRQLVDHVFWSKAQYIIDDTKSEIKMLGKVAYPTFTVYELV